MPPFQPVPSRLEEAAPPLLTVALVIGGLYVGRDLLAPMALALLLTIAVLPVVEWLESHHVPRVAAVVAVLCGMLIVFGAMIYVVAQQVYHLATELPRYETALRTKLEVLGSGSGLLDDLGKLLTRLDDTFLQGAPPEGPRVFVAEAKETPLAIVRRALGLILTPAAILAITLLLMAFVLVQRDDLRDRALRVAGTHDLHRTTRAMQEATRRVGHYLFMQVSVNALFGFVMAIGLSAFSIPNAPLWGVIAFTLRFIPFLGAPLSALMPAIVAFVTKDGWLGAVLVLAWFAVVDIAISYVIEPLVYGSSTGISPLAVVISSIFWGALWGPMGLILAPAITACLGILGRTMPRLGILDVLLSDRAPLAPDQRFYQRLLAGDARGAADMLAVEAARTDELGALRGLAQPALLRLMTDRTAEDFDPVMVLGATRTLLRALDEDPSNDGRRAEIAVLAVGGAVERVVATVARIALRETGTIVTDRLVDYPLAGVIIVLANRMRPERLARVLAEARANTQHIHIYLAEDDPGSALLGLLQTVRIIRTLDELLELAELSDVAQQRDAA